VETVGEAIELPDAPAWLGDAGRAEWERLGSIAAELGQLEKRFLPSLERLCDAYDRLAEAREDIATEGRTSITDKGFEHARPAVAMEKEARDEIRRYLLEFGWTPSAANGVKIETNKKAGLRTRKRA
jgi:P27 family predicted phage terminase small subunit